MRATIHLCVLVGLICLGAGCNSAKTVTGGNNSDQLFANRWDLTELRGKPINRTDRVQPHLLFESGDVNKISGSVGCNLLAGTVLLGANTIKFSPLITTKMACPDQNLEYQFSGVLEQVNAWEIVDQSLLLKVGEKPAAKLKAVKRN